jgi:ATP-dependent RNA helicase CshB
LQPYFCIIFANTRKIASEVYQTMLEHQYNCVLLHKDLSTRQRKTIFKAINKNQYQYLIASDLASRGIDIQGADVIISIGLPEDDV